MSNWSRRSNRPNVPRSTRLRQRARRALPYICAACGLQGGSVRAANGPVVIALELDHITNIAEGGTDTLDNLQYLCPDCHKAKTQTERQRGIDRAREQRGGHLSRRYRDDSEPHPGQL